MREVRRGLQQQSGLANARLAAEQHQRSRDDAAAEHAIELADAGCDAVGFRCFNFRVLLRTGCGNSRHRIAMRRRPARHAFEWALFDKRAPRAAVVALALPLGPLHAAFLADEDRFSLFHYLSRTLTTKNTENTKQSSSRFAIAGPKLIVSSSTRIGSVCSVSFVVNVRVRCISARHGHRGDTRFRTGSSQSMPPSPSHRSTYRLASRGRRLDRPGRRRRCRSRPRSACPY